MILLIHLVFDTCSVQSVILFLFFFFSIQMAFLSSLKQIAGIESGSKARAFMDEFFKLVLGTLSLPIDFPGTNYRRGFQASPPI